MTKQEFLAMSLPHKLKVYVKYNHKPDNSELETMIGIVDDCIITDMHEEDMAPLSVSNYGLCFRPLSDLTKEIEHKGEKFNPIVKIAEILGYQNISLKGNDCQVGLIESGSSCIKETLRYIDNYFYIDVEDYYYSSDSVRRYKDGIFMDHFQLFQKLIEWHFDIADLISKGEAIDVNTLEENPYK